MKKTTKTKTKTTKTTTKIPVMSQRNVRNFHDIQPPAAAAETLPYIIKSHNHHDDLFKIPNTVLTPFWKEIRRKEIRTRRRLYRHPQATILYDHLQTGLVVRDYELMPTILDRLSDPNYNNYKDCNCVTTIAYGFGDNRANNGGVSPQKLSKSQRRRRSKGRKQILQGIINGATIEKSEEMQLLDMIEQDIGVTDTGFTDEEQQLFQMVQQDFVFNDEAEASFIQNSTILLLPHVKSSKSNNDEHENKKLIDTAASLCSSNATFFPKEAKSTADTDGLRGDTDMTNQDEQSTERNDFRIRLNNLRRVGEGANFLPTTNVSNNEDEEEGRQHRPIQDTIISSASNDDARQQKTFLTTTKLLSIDKSIDKKKTVAPNQIALNDNYSSGEEGTGRSCLQQSPSTSTAADKGSTASAAVIAKKYINKKKLLQTVHNNEDSPKVHLMQEQMRLPATPPSPSPPSPERNSSIAASSVSSFRRGVIALKQYVSKQNWNGVWHTIDSHKEDRERMLDKIRKILLRRMSINNKLPPPQLLSQLPEISNHVEEYLYKSASSLANYKDESSLLSRLRVLSVIVEEGTTVTRTTTTKAAATTATAAAAAMSSPPPQQKDLSSHDVQTKDMVTVATVVEPCQNKRSSSCLLGRNSTKNGKFSQGMAAENDSGVKCFHFRMKNTTLASPPKSRKNETTTFKKPPNTTTPHKNNNNTPKPYYCTSLFWRVVWPALEKLGWTREYGNRSQDFYLLPKGVTRKQGRGRYTPRVDYFDSLPQVMHFLKIDDRWNTKEDVKIALDKFEACLKLGKEIRSSKKKKEPVGFSPEWIVKEVEGQKMRINTSAEK